ncbi:hypothetical protein QOM21_27850 [Streptomyces sp. Pv4-95]|uniref:hypothetical protein n=1 Tax=Streptomyces sp. Pv4-95 TaxID=3049543 RepID=UPI0038928F28
MGKGQNRKSAKNRGAERRSDRERKPQGSEESAAERTQDLKPRSRNGLTGE